MSNEPQAHIPVAANILGSIGTILWCVQLLPQIWQNWRRKGTDGLPAGMMIIWALANPPFGVYAIIQGFNIPVQVQPHILAALCIVTLCQILIYTHKWSTWKAISICILFALTLAGIEVLLVLLLKVHYRNGGQKVITTLGIIGVVLQVVGFIPLYYEMIKRRGRVINISWIFIGVDTAGGLFLLASLAVQETFDVPGACTYGAVLVAETLVWMSHVFWLFRTRHIRRSAKAAGVSYDEFEEYRRKTDVTINKATTLEDTIQCYTRQKAAKDDTPYNVEVSEMETSMV